MSLLPRAIVHLDLDAFFAAVEVLENRKLKDKALIIGGRHRGVVATASYKARESGVHSAMPMARALRLCPDAIVLSVAGFPEMKVFDQLSSYVNFLYRTRLIAEIYRPAAETMALRALGKRRAEILAAVEKAGGELVESKSVAKETMEAITQPIGSDFGSFAKTGNLMWKSCIAEGVTPKEFRERGMKPRPDSIETFLMIMPMGFNPEKAGDTKAVMQFNLSGETNGTCHFTIDHGEIRAQAGTAENPDLTIEAPFELWMDILTGKADGQQMFLAQKYTVAGDISLLMRMGELFGR